MRILFFILLININIFSNNIIYPKIFYKMGEPLFNITNKFQNLTLNNEIKRSVEDYALEVDKIIHIGLKADKIDSLDKDKKNYLFALRKLQKHYDLILNELRKELLFNIRQSNYSAVKKILDNDISIILLKRLNVLNPTLNFYKKNKKLGKITILDTIIINKKNQTIILNSQKRFINKGRYIQDKQTGLLWQRNGYESGRLNFYQAEKYAKHLSIDDLEHWRLPTVKEFTEIYKEKDDIAFIYAPFLRGETAYWSSEMSYDMDDYATLFIWPEDYKKGGPNGCYASKNWYYVRAVHDPIN